MSWVYDAGAGRGLGHELERMLDIVAGALFIEATFMPGMHPDRERYLTDLYQVVQEFLQRWRSIAIPREP